MDADVACRVLFESNDRFVYTDSYKRRAMGGIDRAALPWRTIAMLADWVRDYSDNVHRRELEILGNQLYSLLFGGEVGEAFADSLGAFYESGGHQRQLRLELCFHPDAAEVAKLPWEFLYKHGTPGGFFLAGERTGLVLTRLVPPDPERPSPDPAEHPLRVMVASCRHGEDARSDVEQIQDAIRRLNPPGDIDLKELEDPTFDQLRETAEAYQPHVLHLIAHGDSHGLIMRRKSDPARQLLDSADQFAGIPVEPMDAVPVNARTMKSMFDRHRPHLVLLHACDGDAPSLTSRFSTAREIAYAGVPAVVAMQYQIRVKDALAFVQRFYEVLAQGHRVGEAATAGRRQLARDEEGKDEREDWSRRLFGTPVVYVQRDAPLMAARPVTPSRSSVPKPPPMPTTQAAAVPGQRRCAACGKANNAGNKVCRGCGASLLVCMCGHRYDDPKTDDFCGECGTPLRIEDRGEQSRLPTSEGLGAGPIASQLRDQDRGVTL